VDLTAKTEARRVRRSAQLGPERASLGQFFTPEPAAALIASMLDLPGHGSLRVLDPGAGVGSLTAALAARAAAEAPSLRLAATAVEVDEALIGDLTSTLEECARSDRVAVEAVHADFVGWARAQIKNHRQFDVVIMNPPYRKITKGSRESAAFHRAGVDTTNLYAGFVTLALRLLAPRGQLVAITPRSFANGSYFKAFRAELLSTAAIQRIHVFDSRNVVFKDSEVLQENIIMTVRAGVSPDKVIISSSKGFTDPPREHHVTHEAVVDPNQSQRFIRIATEPEGLETAAEMAALPAVLADLGLSVSTGPVVDFRAKEHLRPALEDGAVPLIYPGHLVQRGCRWPEGAPRKAAALRRNTETKGSLLPAGIYVVVKRFSAKEEPRRVVASLITPNDLPGDSWAFENHLNVYHMNHRGLDAGLAEELVDYLNSDLVDAFVRLFNGHTQINAGDLRSLRYPAFLCSWEASAQFNPTTLEAVRAS
jgi:adenine-specific DNA-methyltransferase